ncbi:M28 family peptidase [Nocardia sp. ET3-3]|uniref:M28 family peptidase n=1 Tax=Nocardia terrae TaxID=2675851 RepID=A0A7K1UZ13_9NOCA|nr:M28 family peptidase [Nocardia terrae]MVU79118.1 M28 family peptidase [Nocardia terrae]
MRVGRGLRGFLSFALLLAVVVATAWAQQPHGYRDANAPDDVFSAARAFTHVREIGGTAHPVGTAEHDRVRDYLADQLRKLGVETEIRTGVGRFPRGLRDDNPNLGRVDNIVGRIPGTASTGTVYLAAHYDSVPSAPGANDNGVGVGAVLETVRALRSNPAGLRNDLVVLLTDGEEPGLLGAEAFVAEGGYDRDHGVVINHDARGAGGPPLLWRLTRPEGALIEAVADAVPHANSDSLTTAVAGEGTSSNTDFTSFKPGGLRVLDWAYTGKSAYYHSRMDDPAHVDKATLQQLGENTLAQAREFGSQDLGDTGDRSNPAYFALPFGTLAVVPVWVIIALAVVMVLAAAWTIRQVHRTGEATATSLVLAPATAVLTVPLTIAATSGLWTLLRWIRPAYASGPVDPFRPEFFHVAVLTLSVTVLLAWYAFARRVFGTTAAPIGLLTGIVALGAVFAALAPAAAQVIVAPTAPAAVGTALTFVVPERWRLPLLTVFLLPAAVFLGLTAWSGVQAGLGTAPYLAAPVTVLFGGLLLMVLARSWPRRSWPIPLTALIVVAALAAAGLAVDRFDDQHPRRTPLAYALDADRNEARWISTLPPDDWTRTFVGHTAPGPRYDGLWDSMVSSGPAPLQPLPAPTAEILADSTDAATRTLRLRLTSPRSATRIDLSWDNAPRSLRVAGREITPAPAKGFHFYAPAPEGIEVELTAPAGPLTLRLTDYSWLPDSHLDALPSPPGDVYFQQNSAAAVFRTVALP